MSGNSSTTYSDAPGIVGKLSSFSYYCASSLVCLPQVTSLPVSSRSAHAIISTTVHLTSPCGRGVTMPLDLNAW